MKKNSGCMPIVVVLILLCLVIWLCCELFVIPGLNILFGLALVVAACVYFHKQHKKRTANLGGGFLRHCNAGLTEDELLQVILLEEIERIWNSGLHLQYKRTLRRQILFTAVYILVNIVTMLLTYYSTVAVLLGTVYTLIYLFLLYRFADPMQELCTAVKQRPDDDFSQIIRDMAQENPAAGKKVTLVSIAAFVLSLLILFCGHTEPAWTFEATDGGAYLTDFSPAIGDYAQAQIPATYQGQPVVAIGDQVFAGMSGLETVTIPETVTHIGSGAFKNCRNLQNLRLPAGLKTLNGEAFMDCKSLQKIIIPTGVTEIRGNTFDGCSNLQSVQLHDGIVDIHAYAFQGCGSLESIDLPEKITSIHTYCFAQCDELTSVVIPEGVVKISAHAFHGCDKLHTVDLPDSLQEIRSSAFRECESLKEIELPKDTTVDERAFKESPTKVTRRTVTKVQWEQIVAEAEKKNPDTYYYFYKKESPDTLWDYGDGESMLLADDKRALVLQNAETDALQVMQNDAELLAYLKKGKAAGRTQLKIYIYSELGSRIAGEDYFVIATASVDEWITACQEALAEENNG